jgi:hypothetical protein
MAYFKPKIPILAKFFRVLQWKMLVDYMAIWSILRLFVTYMCLWTFGNFVFIWYIFTKINLAVRPSIEKQQQSWETAQSKQGVTFWREKSLVSRSFMNRFQKIFNHCIGT